MKEIYDKVLAHAIMEAEIMGCLEDGDPRKLVV